MYTDLLQAYYFYQKQIGYLLTFQNNPRLTISIHISYAYNKVLIEIRVKIYIFCASNTKFEAIHSV